MWSYFAVLDVIWHILDIFSAHGDPIQLIPFALFWASQDTRLDYQQHIIRETKITTFLGLTHFIGPLNIFCGEQHLLPNTP